MHYGRGAGWRPLFETTEAMLQLGSGCSHNACKFCNMYKGSRFRISPSEEVEADIDELARWLYNPERIFLTGGNALGLPQENLVFALERIREQLPNTKTVGCFGRIGDIKGKSDEQLRELAALHLDDVSIGAESGYDPALAFMRKGHSSADIVEQCARLDAVGIGYDLFYLAGIAGADAWEKNVRATVDVFGRTHPRRIMIHTLTALPGAPLLRDIASGAFVPAAELDIVREIRMLCAELPNDVFMLGSHYANAAQFDARLPEDRAQVLAFLDRVIQTNSEERLRFFRASVRSM